MNPIPSETPHPRTEAALQRLKRAMSEIEAEIAANGGVYPCNHGRVTQSELCRRADVKKATLQNPVHKETTRVEVMAWCERINAGLLQQRTRERSTPLADAAAAEVEALRGQNLQLLRRIAELERELASLRGQAA